MIEKSILYFVWIQLKMMHDIAYSSSALGRMYSGGGVTNIHNNNGAIKLDKTNNPSQKLWSSSIAEGQYYSSHPHTQPLMPQSIAIDSLISLTRFTVIHDSICLKISSIKCHQYSDFVIILNCGENFHYISDFIERAAFNTLGSKPQWPPFQNTFSYAKIVVFWFKRLWNLFPRVQLIINQHWIR